MATRVYRVVVGPLASIFLAACAADYVGEESEVIELVSAPLKLKRECKDNPDDIYKPVGGNQGGQLGDVVRCAKNGRISTEEITQALASRAFVGIDVQKAVKLFRISYRTQRLAGKADLATALVALPAKKDNTANKQGLPEEDDDDEDKVKSGGRAPLIVFAHGTAPYGNKCASSKLKPLQCSTTNDHDTELVSIIALASQGYPVIAPDYAGYVEGSRAAGYLLSEDEAHSLLDATRAMNKLRQKTVDKVVFVGHSQGGHAVLSAQALARSYGLAGQLVGVAAMAPFWAPARLLGALGVYGPPFESDPTVLAFIIQYFYTHAEVYDGPGQGKLLFKPNVANALPNYVNTCDFNATTCNFINAPPSSFGLAPDFFEQNFFTAVSECGISRAACDANPVAQKWEKRFKADRPKIDRNGAPIVLWHGAFDAVIPLPFAGCAHDKIASDLSGTSPTKYKFCGDPEADHDQILSRDLAWVTRWIDARALGAPEPDPQQCLDYATLSSIVGPENAACPPVPEPTNVD